MTIGVVLLLWLLPLRSEVPPTLSATEPIAEMSTIVSLQDLTDDLRGRLHITERVHVTLVDHNPLVMSVETLGGRTGPFVITVDRDFIQELNQPEVEAAIAHELGHVWIYTHQPYRADRSGWPTTSRCASINRSAFEPVYEKVWAANRHQGEPDRIHRPPTAFGTQATASASAAFPNTSTIVAVTVPVFLNVCIAPPLSSSTSPAFTSTGSCPSTVSVS